LAKTSKSRHDIELEPDAWARFERAMAVVVKSPPQHRPSKANSKKRSKKKSAKSVSVKRMP
jgi:hypothetical protein